MAKAKAAKKRPSHSLKITKDKVGEWRWTVKARNGKVLACGGEGYKNRTDCLGGILAVFKVLVSNIADEIEVIDQE